MALTATRISPPTHTDGGCIALQTPRAGPSRRRQGRPDHLAPSRPNPSAADDTEDEQDSEDGYTPPTTKVENSKRPTAGTPISTPKPAARVGRSRSASRSLPPSRTEKRYKCEYEGCEKAYTKPARLREHELSHTGERPHACPHCSQTYIRPTHLTAHLRTHLPASDKPFMCTEPECGKRFWTATHLSRHEAFHRDANVYACPHCAERFHKTNHLRDHVTLAHMPAGTKPYLCTHEGCDSSFALRHQLKAHEKTHDPTRYTCAHPSHPIERFSTWSALQKHMHTAHPPTCPVDGCGAVFAQAYRLKEHLRCHPELWGVEVEGGRKRRKRRRQGDEGARVSKEKEMEEDAKHESAESGSKRRRVEGVDFVGQEEDGRECAPSALNDFTGGVSTIAAEQQAMADIEFDPYTGLPISISGSNSAPSPYLDPSESTLFPMEFADGPAPLASTSTTTSNAPPPPPPSAVLSGFTGAALAVGGAEHKRFPCPLQLLVAADEHAPAPAPAAGAAVERCFARFWRVYDVVRHLRAEHGVEMAEGEVRDLMGLPEGS